MGLLILSLLLSAMGGCVAWLLLGDRLPLDSDTKWETWQNIALYSLAIVVPIYLLIFSLF